MAHLKAFLQRKNIFVEQSKILAFLGTLTDVRVQLTRQESRWKNLNFKGYEIKK